jgi:hypothetical protein
MPWITPKTDWDTNPTNPLPSDFNRIEGNIDFLSTDIETKKGLIVDALNSVGIATLIADTHVQLASKITGAKKTGISITPGTSNKEIPKGIYDTGGGTVLGDPDLISANIKAGINIFGVAGNSNVVDTSPGTAVAGDILTTKIAFADGVQITGNMPDRGAVNQTLLTQGASYTIPAGKHNGAGIVTANFANLSAENIKNGVNVGGIIGNLIPLNGEKKYQTALANTVNISNLYYISASGLTFTPRIIVWIGTSTYDLNKYGGVAFLDGINKGFRFSESTGSSYSVSTSIASGNYIAEKGFRLQISSYNAQYAQFRWYAFE